MSFDTVTVRPATPAIPGVPIPEKIIVVTERGWSHRPNLDEGFSDSEEIARETCSGWDAAEKRAAEILAGFEPATMDLDGLSGLSVGFKTIDEDGEEEWAHTYGTNLDALKKEVAAHEEKIVNALSEQVHIESRCGWNSYTMLRTALAEELVRRGDTTTQIHGRLKDHDKPLGQYFARAEWEDDGSDYIQQTPCTWCEAPRSKSDAERSAAEILNALA